MPFIITEACIGVKDASCVDVCPVDCIYSDPASEMYFIHPVECIDCSACVDVCPVNAIYAQDEVPGPLVRYIAINAEYFSSTRATAEALEDP